MRRDLYDHGLDLEQPIALHSEATLNGSWGRGEITERGEFTRDRLRYGIVRLALERLVEDYDSADMDLAIQYAVFDDLIFG